MNCCRPALFALLFQLVPPLGIWLLALASYAGPRRIPLSLEEPVTLTWLLLSGAVSWGLAGRAAMRLLTGIRPMIAIPLTALCCGPAWFAGALYFHAALVFVGWA